MREPETLPSAAGGRAGHENAHQAGQGLVGSHPHRGRAPAPQRLRPGAHVRRGDPAHRDRRRHCRLGRGQERRRQRRHLRRARASAEPRGRADADRPRPARHRPDLGDALQRLARHDRGRGRPRDAADRAARPDGRRDQRRRHRALGHLRQGRRRAGLAAARRPQAAAMPAYASGGWAGADGIGDQLKSYIAKGGFKAVKMRVGAMDGPPHVSAARVAPRAPRSARTSSSWSMRTAPTRSPTPSASCSWSPTATSPGSRSR